MAVDEKTFATMEFEGAGVEVRRVYWYMFYDAVEITAGGRAGWVTSAVTGPTPNDLTLGWLIARLDGDPQPAIAILAEAGRAGNEMYEIFHFPKSARGPEIWVRKLAVTPRADVQSEVSGASVVKGSIFVTRSMEQARGWVSDIKAKAAAAGKAKQE